MRFFQFLQCAFEFLGIVNGSVERVCQKVLYSEINADHLRLFDFRRFVGNLLRRFAQYGSKVVAHSVAGYGNALDLTLYLPMDYCFNRLALRNLDEVFSNGQRGAVITALSVPFTFELRKSSLFLEKSLVGRRAELLLEGLWSRIARATCTFLTSWQRTTEV